MGVCALLVVEDDQHSVELRALDALLSGEGRLLLDVAPVAPELLRSAREKRLDIGEALPPVIGGFGYGMGSEALVETQQLRIADVLHHVSHGRLGAVREQPGKRRNRLMELG